MSSPWTPAAITRLMLALGAGYVVYRFAGIVATAPPADAGNGPARAAVAAAGAATPRAAATCVRSDFQVGTFKTRLVYENVAFTGTVTNKGQTACGVQLKASTYDITGAVLDTEDFWPASIRNIEPGATENFTFHVRYDKAATNYDVITIDAKDWRPLK